MPEVYFRVRWPDGSDQRCSSPSRAIERCLAAGGAYPVPEFVRRARSGLEAAERRVLEARGFACTAAGEQLAELERRAAGLTVGAGARVHVEEVGEAGGPGPIRRLDGRRREAVVIGAGHAGLAASRALGQRGIDHLVLERDRVGHAWRKQRWDSFTLVTPNWQCRLPGHPYAGDDPDGFMARDEVVRYVEDYAASFDPPLAEGVEVHALRRAGGAFELSTTAGDVEAGQVVLAVGGYHQPRMPPAAEKLPEAVTQLHSSTYRNPDALPDGAVLVVGSGQSGAQIAEDLHLAGRQVHLGVGSAPRVARSYRGRDVVAWLHDMGHYDVPIDSHPEGKGARREPNHYVSGRDGGHDIDLRRFALDGMHLHGRLGDVRGSVVATAGDLEAHLDAADAVSERIKGAIDDWIKENGVSAPTERGCEPVWRPQRDGPGELDLEHAGVSTVIWATGFRKDWSWVHEPAFDAMGYPDGERGASSVAGLFAVGLPWLHTWGSGRFASAGADAEHVAGLIAQREPNYARSVI